MIHGSGGGWTDRLAMRWWWNSLAWRRRACSFCLLLFFLFPRSFGIGRHAIYSRVFFTLKKSSTFCWPFCSSVASLIINRRHARCAWTTYKYQLIFFSLHPIKVKCRRAFTFHLLQSVSINRPIYVTAIRASHFPYLERIYLVESDNSNRLLG